MTSDELKAKFPNASAAFLAANRDHNARSAPVLEPCPRHEPLEAPSAEERHPASFHVRILSIRKRLLDEDNLCEKFHVDCLRRNGFIPDDDPATTRIEVRQRKCERGEPERVVLTVEYVG